MQAVVDIFGPTDLTRDFSHLKFGLTTVPFLIIHGDKDPIVPVEQSRDFHAALWKAGKDSTYIELPTKATASASPAACRSSSAPPASSSPNT